MSDIFVGEVPVGEDEIAREAQYHPAGSWEVARHEAARALVVRELLLAEAERKGMCSAHRELDERAGQRVIEHLLEAEVPVPEIAEDECVRYHAERAERFTAPTLMEASHILIGAPQGGPERESARAKATQVLAELAPRPERFEALAREHSACPSATAGGRLGQLGPGETAPEFERALARLSPGELSSSLVESQHGFHIVLLNQRSEGRRLPYETVKARLQLFLRERAWRRAVRSYIAELARSSNVQGFDLDSPAPAVVNERHAGEERGVHLRTSLDHSGMPSDVVQPMPASGKRHLPLVHA